MGLLRDLFSDSRPSGYSEAGIAVPRAVGGLRGYCGWLRDFLARRRTRAHLTEAQVAELQAMADQGIHFW